MFEFNDSPFSQRPNIPATAQVVFVSDVFADEYTGGAELTSQALIDSSPFEVFKIKSKHVTVEVLKEGADKLWVFGNFAELNPQLIPTIIGNLKYTVLEYDYKYCRARSPEKHFATSGVPCDCHNQTNGKIVSAFFFGAMGLWWMSEAQKDKYFTLFPFLVERDNVVLSSVFSDKTLGLIKLLRAQSQGAERKGWIVLGSSSWIKGADSAKKWCEDNGKDCEVVWNLPYEQLLDKLSRAEGFVYLPPGGDTCPRMVIEAKLLGCKLQLNGNVQHKDEEWFATDDVQAIEEYLYTARKTFWNGVKEMIDYRPTVSGYTTTLNCVKQQYPFEQCIQSMLEFCDEVCVVDGGSTDGTLEALEAMAQREPKLKVKQVKRDWTSKHHPVFDGMQKAEARSMCTKEFCWQMDCDEVVHEDDAKKVTDMCRAMPREAPILALPVVEYWGGLDKVRMDVTPWKWRLSRNLPDITHGIPADLRRTGTDGEAYVAPGTDGCDMVSKSTGERINHLSFYTQEADNVRRVALLGNEQARREYEAWFNQVVAGLPSVFHYSWYDLPRKIRLYRDYWTRHWVQITGDEYRDTAETNMMFDAPWSLVTDEMIEARAVELKQIGGWIWHRKWDGSKTPWIACNRSQPKVMQ